MLKYENSCFPADSYGDGRYCGYGNGRYCGYGDGHGGEYGCGYGDGDGGYGRGGGIGGKGIGRGNIADYKTYIYSESYSEREEKIYNSVHFWEVVA